MRVLHRAQGFTRGLLVSQESVESFDVKQALMVIEKAMHDANITAYEIDEIIPVGDSSRISKLRPLIQQRFGSNVPVHEDIEPALVTTHGAAITGSTWMGDIVTPCMVMDVTGWALGTTKNSRGC